jgi:hypothetical protein
MVTAASFLRKTGRLWAWRSGSADSGRGGSSEDNVSTSQADTPPSATTMQPPDVISKTSTPDTTVVGNMVRNTLWDRVWKLMCAESRREWSSSRQEDFNKTVEEQIKWEHDTFRT